MAYGTVKVDNVTFTYNAADATTTFSGFYASTTNNLTLSGTASAATFTGTTANFTNVNAQNIGVTTALSGLAITGGTAGFTTVTGTTVTGTTANFVSGVFTTKISGTTVTGTTASFTSGVFASLSGTTHTITSGVFALGTAALPSISFVSDPNTGIFSPGADQVAVATNGTGRLFVDASGNVGVGAAPSAVTFGGLDVRSGGLGLVLGADSGAATRTDATTKLGRYLSPHYLNAEEPVAALIASNDSTESIISIGGGTGLANAATTVRFFTAANNTTLSGSERLRITSAGLVGVGTSSPSTNTEINAALDTGASLGLNEGQLSIGREANSGGAIRIGYDTTNNFGFISSGRVGVSWDKLILNAGGGNVGIGTSSPGYSLDVRGDIGATIASKTAEFNAAGTSIYAAFNDGTKTWRAGVGILGAGLFTIRNHTDAVNPVTITAVGNVGIGTTGPQAPLHVRATAGAANDRGILIQDTTVGTAGEAWLSFKTQESTDEERVKGAIVYANAGSSVGRGNLLFLLDSVDDNGSATTSDEKMRITYDGKLLVGTSTARDNYFSSGSGQSLQFQIEGTDYKNSCASFTSNSTSAGFGPHLAFGRSRGAAVGSNTLVNNGDTLGVVVFHGNDGSKFVQGARIDAEVDGTPGGNDMPGRLVFSTTADGAASPTPGLRIANNRQVDIYTNGGTGIWTATQRAAGTSDQVYQASYGATDFQTGTVSYKVYTNGNVENANNSYLGISDIKLKENIVDANSQWNDLKALQVRNFNFKEGQTHTQIGLIAQEVELVSPGLVNESPDRDGDGNDLGTVTKSVNYSVLYMKAVKALQEAMERIEQLETNNTDLLARVIALEAN